MKKEKRFLQKLLSFVLAFAMIATSGAFMGQPLPAQAEVTDEGLILHYDFVLQNSFATDIPDTSRNGNNGILKRVSGSVEGSYSISDANIYGTQAKALVLPGGADGSYLQFPDGILEGKDAVTISAWVNLSTDTAYQRIWDFGNDVNSYIYLLSDGGNLGKKGYAAAITKEGWSKEQGIQKGTDEAPLTLDKNRWVLTTVVMDGSKMSLYENGKQIKEAFDTGIAVKDLGKTTANFLGKGQFTDPPTKGKFADIRIYNRALSAAEIGAMYQVTDEKIVAADKAELDIGGGPFCYYRRFCASSQRREWF